MAELKAPPPMSFFDGSRAKGGAGRFLLRLDDLDIELVDLDEGLAATLRERFGAYCEEGPANEGVLRVQVWREAQDYFMTPGPKAEFNRVLLACDGKRIRYAGHQVAGWFDSVGNNGELILAQGDYEKPEGAVENYLRAAVAWRAAERGGALVHAASAVLDDRGYLFYGSSGAGKSTLSECNRSARVVSDDLTLILPGRDGRLDIVGSPFRGTYTGGAPVTGRFPLVAGFRLVQGSTAEVRPVARTIAFAEFVGSLPFVAEAFGQRPDLFESVEKSFAAVPLARLAFRKDDSYWAAIREAGL